MVQFVYVCICRCRVQVFGGRQGKVATSDTYLLALDTFKWTPVSPTGPNHPTPRLMHAAACIRDKVGTPCTCRRCRCWGCGRVQGSWVLTPITRALDAYRVL
jgi:hypothetical protein